MKEFEKTKYEKVAYISFDSNPRLDTLFQKDLNVKRLLDGLNIEVGSNITLKVIPSRRGNKNIIVTRL